MSTRSLTQRLATSTELVHIAVEGIIELLQHPRIEAEDRIEVMLALTRRKPAAVFWPVFHETWCACDNTYRVRDRLLKALSKRDAQARSTDYLPLDAQAFLEQLPNPFTAFRGCVKSRMLGLSWTTSEARAEQFARDGAVSLPSPSVVTASVPKSAVFGVYHPGEDAELVINPRRVRLSIRALPKTNAVCSPDTEWEQLVEQVRRERGDGFVSTLTDAASLWSN